MIDIQVAPLLMENLVYFTRRYANSFRIVLKSLCGNVEVHVNLFLQVNRRSTAPDFRQLFSWPKKQRYKAVACISAEI